MAKTEFKQKLSSALANATYFLKTEPEDTITAKTILDNDLVESGPTISNIQGFTNELASIDGVVGENDPNALTYSSEEIISNGDDRKVAIGKLDDQVKVNLDDIANIFQLIADGALKLKSYATDSAYELDNGAPSGGEIYYNTTTGFIRYYDGDVNNEWRNVGSGGTAEQYNIGTGNGVQTDFVIPVVPTSDESVLVVLNGLVIENSEYSIVGGVTVSFNTAPYAAQSIYVYVLTDGTPSNPPINAGDWRVDYITITPTDISNEEATFAAAPANPARVLVDMYQGSSQFYGLDFQITANIIQWSGLGLAGQISAGDILRIAYIV